MVATERWYPPGFMGSEDAILRIAKIRDPSRWKSDAMAPAEDHVWHELGKDLNATYIRNHLGTIYKGDVLTIDRLYDYSEALAELRGALFDGDLVAFFLDENGKQDFILKDGWGGSEGGEILLRGVVDLVDGWRRLIMLKSDDIDNFAKSLPSASTGSAEDRAATKARALKQPVGEVFKKMDEWRSSKGDYIPTKLEDEAAMRAAGINRDDARELRKNYPRRPRGRPKADKK
jgi:hypothetical protein